MRFLILAAASLALLACTFVATPSEAQLPPPASTILTATGDAQTLQAEADDEPMQWAASVVMVNFLENQGGSAGVKLFGTAGGDPAMNGLYTHIAFYQGAAEGWRVFRLGDFVEYRVISDAPGRVNLELFDHTMGADDVIRERVRYAIVTWTPGADGTAPETVTMTPAEASEP